MVWKRHDEAPEVAEVALLPGSRRKEVDLILPVQLEAASILARRVKCRFRLLRAPGIAMDQLNRILSRTDGAPGMDVAVVSGSVEEALKTADCAIVKSGTATLETMLSGVPFAMVYKLSTLSWALLRPLVRNQVFCLANLVAGKQLVPEFVQWQATGAGIADYLESILTTPGKLASIQEEFKGAVERLGVKDAYTEAALAVSERFLTLRELRT